MKLLTLGLAGLLASGAMQQIRADAGTGAVIGAVAGGIIGHQSRETAAGVVVGAVAGGLIGGALDRGRSQTTTVVEYRSGGHGGYYDPRCEDPRWAPRPVRYVYPNHPVVVCVPTPRPRAVVYVQTPAPCPEPVVIVRPTPAPTCLADEFGYTSTEYLALMKPIEVNLLRQRAYGQSQSDLAVYLTDQEKGNLRARAANQVVIGG